MITLGIDLGTSGVKLALVGDDDTVLATASRALTVQRPHPGHSEQDPAAWWAATCEALDELGYWYVVSGDVGVGIDVLGRGLELVQDGGGLQWEGRLRTRMATALDAIGRAAEAQEHWAAAARVHLARGEHAQAVEAEKRCGARISALPRLASVAPVRRSHGWTYGVRTG